MMYSFDDLYSIYLSSAQLSILAQFWHLLQFNLKLYILLKQTYVHEGNHRHTCSFRSQNRMEKRVEDEESVWGLAEADSM